MLETVVLPNIVLEQYYDTFFKYSFMNKKQQHLFKMFFFLNFIR